MRPDHRFRMVSPRFGTRISTPERFALALDRHMAGNLTYLQYWERMLLTAGPGRPGLIFNQVNGQSVDSRRARITSSTYFGTLYSRDKRKHASYQRWCSASPRMCLICRPIMAPQTNISITGFLCASQLEALSIQIHCAICIESLQARSSPALLVNNTPTHNDDLPWTSPKRWRRSFPFIVGAQQLKTFRLAISS